LRAKQTARLRPSDSRVRPRISCWKFSVRFEVAVKAIRSDSETPQRSVQNKTGTNLELELETQPVTCD
jgi:hypothetical protein